MRRLFALAIVASLLCPALLAGPAIAVSQRPDVAPPVTTDVQGDCVLGYQQWTWEQNSTSKMSQSRSGVSASILPSLGDFDICANGNGLIAVGPSAWVAIQPRDVEDSDYTQILQMGLIECLGPFFYTACAGENHPHFFYAYGGCTYPGPSPIDLGAANYGSHSYTIYLGTDANWHIVLDGTQRAVVPDAYLSCWTDRLRMATWSGERLNEGDSLGTNTSSAWRTNFNTALVGIYNQGWFSPNFNGGSSGTGCFHRAYDDSCGFSGGGQNFWMATDY